MAFRKSRRPFTKRPAVEQLEDRTTPAGNNLVAFGANAGGLPLVRLYDPQRDTQVRAFLAYDVSFGGGVHVAEGDVNGDGIPDIVTGAGAGGGPHVKLFDGRTGTLITEFFAYDKSFGGGVNVGIGDVTGDGKADIITAAGAGGGPHVRVFDLTGKVETEFFAYDSAFHGGVNVAIGDANGDAQADIITGAGPGGGPHVKVFEGKTGGTLASFYAYAPTFGGGVSVAAADLDNDGTAEVITGAGPGGGPHVRVFGGLGGLKTELFAFATTFKGGVDVGAGDVNGDGTNDILAAQGPGGTTEWRAFDGLTLAKLADKPAFDFPFTGGVGVAGNAPAPIDATNQDAVVAWNSIALQAIRVDKTPPPKASRALAMVSAAVYDAVNAIFNLHAFYHSSPTVDPTADPTAAAAQAAHDVLVSLFPSQATTLFDPALTTWLGKVASGAAKTAGIGLGQQTAADIIAWRSTDGSSTTVSYTPGSNPGDWIPTPSAFAPALLPQWPDVTPFAMSSGSQFRPAGPPALTSQEYADAVNQVESLGRDTGSTRTPDQTAIALFWADGAATNTPPGHWNAIAEQVALAKGRSIAENAQMFLTLNVAEADAGIAAWDAKFTDNFWRPVTAIQKADLDNNADTTKDGSWLPLLVTPPFPTYISGHSTFSGAAATVLTSVFGAIPFTDTGDQGTFTQRSFTNFQQAADEAGMSRIYGGIHYSFDNADGLSTGRALGQLVVNNFLS
jgi:FG-GAP-like repeat/PAP2 superfamily